MVHKGLATAEGQIIDIVEGEAVRNVEVALAIPGGVVAAIGWCAGVRFKFLGRIIKSARVGIGGSVAYAVSEAARDGGFDAVVVAVADGVGVIRYSRSWRTGPCWERSERRSRAD